MGKRWRHWAICALIVALGAAGARLSDRVRLFHLLHLKALDAHFAVRGTRPVSNIVILMMDQKTSDKFTEPTIFWPPHYAKAIQAASDGGAKVMALDLAFGASADKYTKGTTNYDQMLAGAISTASMPVVIGYALELDSSAEAQALPVNMLAAALGLFGFPNITDDDDGFVRYQELLESADPNNPTGEQKHSLALRVAEKYLGVEAEMHDGHLTLAGKEIPLVGQDRKIEINFAGPPETFPQVSLADFIAASERGDRDQLRSWVEGKIVMLGSDSKSDRYDTPFYSVFKGSKWTTPGIEIHANTVHTLIDRSFLRPVPNWVELWAVIAAAILTALTVLWFRPSLVGGWMLVEAVAIAVFTFMLFLRGWVLSTSEILLAMIFTAVGAGIYRFLTTQQRGLLFRKAVSLFVGHQVASSLDDADDIALSGRRLEVTILFTDIRGFTAFTEKVCDEQGPEVVVKLLNEYMAMMVSLIVAHSGHVNKFIGDGILAVFCDEDKGAVPGDHARRAVKCATRMVTAPSQFKSGAGIHTGLAVVGNIGSAEKMEFTVLGDTVNLASRLESLNKEQHTCLIMSDATQRNLGGEVETVELGAVPVRGKAAPIILYTVASLVPATVEKDPVHA
jgi:adenylate cyclase